MKRNNTDGRQAAKDALETDVGISGLLSEDDPYWLCNCHGEVNTDDMADMADSLREDAAALETASERIDAGEWTAEAAALYIAANANYGRYGVDRAIADPPEVPDSAE
ncbi:hypothetical protein [Natrinema pallidum]|uniref:Uncharacterized protein n=1 Tax=Natrinema pallidum TaxID=69527 RepID=A0A4P9TKC9_9EURY|nr:hypothetical protein [Natrinema pallidum]QCW05277.1 hypothetical protein FGF80_18715 [Natrinema pallidum]